MPAITDPTPEEIAAACAEIRATWTEKERALRWRLAHSPKGDYRPLPGWIPPTISNEELGLAPDH